MTHATHMHKEDNTALFGIAAAAALLGVATALMFAPKSGKDTRDDMIRKMHEAQERSKKRMDDAKAAAADKIDTLQTKTRDKSKEMADNAVDEMASQARDAQDVVAEARSQVEDAAATMQTHARTPRSRTTP